MYRLAKRAVTLIEMLIVMFLIALIIGVVAYNYQGSLDEGKAFATKTSIEKLHTVLLLKEAESGDVDLGRWEEYVKSSPLVKNASQLTKDGWGQKFEVERDSQGEIVISSRKYEEYKKKNPGSLFKDED